MASINLSGVLRDSLGAPSKFNKVRFTHNTTTGTTIKGFQEYGDIEEDGSYSFDVQYGNVQVETQDIDNKRWVNHGVFTINADTPATSLPVLLGITNPVEDPDLIVIQALVADAEAAVGASSAEADRAGVEADRAKTEADRAIAEVEDALTDIKEEIGGVNVGGYVNTTVLESVYDYALSEEYGKFQIKSKSDLPYQIDETTYPDPNNDPKLKAFSNINSNNISDYTRLAFRNVAAMKDSSSRLSVGDVCEVLYFNIAGTIPGRRYEIKDTGTADGFEVIDIGSGLFAHTIPFVADADAATYNEARLGYWMGYDKLVTRGHTVEGQGGAAYIKSGTTGTPSTGAEELFFDATGIGWTLSDNQRLDIEQFGCLHTDLDISDRIKAAGDFMANTEAQDQSGQYQFKTLYVPKRDNAFLVPSPISDDLAIHRALKNVVLVGPGDIDFIYKKNVAREGAPSQAFFKGVTPGHLPAFHAETNPVVVIAGDSISSFNANELGQAGSLWQMLCQEIYEQNPDKTITFYNRAIGGQTMADFDGQPTVTPTMPEWYTGTQPWIDYINDLNPHLVIVSFGMNDNGNLTKSQMDSVRSKLKNNSGSTPDIVWGTTPTPNLASIYAGTKSYHERREHDAGIVRTVANFNRDGLLDWGRQINIVRDGQDILDTSLIIAREEEVTPSGAFTYPIQCMDYSVELEVNTSAVGLNQAFLDFQIGNPELYLTDPINNFARLVRDASGNLQMVLFIGATTPIVVNTSFPVPIGTNELLLFEKRANTIVVRFGGNTSEPQIVTNRIVATGGLYLPRMGSQGSNFTNGRIQKINRASYGKPKMYMPSVTTNDVFGYAENNSLPDDGDDKLPSGGNGINHYSSVGLVTIVSPVINMCDWSK